MTNTFNDTTIVINIVNHLDNFSKISNKREILKGLSAKQKYISPKFFYDPVGSELFEKITHLKAYYPTRHEKSILSQLVCKLNIDFRDAHLIELGSGDASKIALILSQLPDTTLQSMHYYPVDISKSAIEKAATNLIKSFPLLSITGVVMDFTSQLHLLPKSGKRIFCFLGSTLGNFSVDERQLFLKKLSDEMHDEDSLILGLDMVKDIRVLETAYNDPQGITALFNQNILRVVNAATDADFNLDHFEHLAFYNSSENRIEMHLEVKKDIEVKVNNSRIFFQKGETIHTENSYKFTDDAIREIVEQVNLYILDTIDSAQSWFKLIHLKKNN